MRRWKCFKQRYRLLRNLDQNQVLYTVEKCRIILKFRTSEVNLRLFLPLIVFPPGKSGRKISGKFEVLKFPVSRKIYVGILGNFFPF